MNPSLPRAETGPGANSEWKPPYDTHAITKKSGHRPLAFVDSWKFHYFSKFQIIYPGLRGVSSLGATGWFSDFILLSPDVSIFITVSEQLQDIVTNRYWDTNTYSKAHMNKMVWVYLFILLLTFYLSASKKHVLFVIDLRFVLTLVSLIFWSDFSQHHLIGW